MVGNQKDTGPQEFLVAQSDPFYDPIRQLGNIDDIPAEGISLELADDQSDYAPDPIRRIPAAFRIGDQVFGGFLMGQTGEELPEEPELTDGEPAFIKVGFGGSASDGLLIYRADGTQEYLPEADVLAGYDPDVDTDWSLEFAVSGGRLVAFSTTAPVGTADTQRYDGNPADQTYYRIPVIRTIVDEKKQFDINGIYRENINCDSGFGIAELVRIG